MLLDQAILLSHRLPDDLIRYVGKYTINQKINGEMEGVWKGWRDNGQLWYECHYKKGKEHGIQRVWFEDGQLAYEEHWKEGQRHGIQKGWFENGQLKYEWFFKEGELVT